MSKELTIHGETLGASQEGTLAVEQFLGDNYRFRFNELSGKVEFITLPFVFFALIILRLIIFWQPFCSFGQDLPSISQKSFI
jgi:hypothetical protein